MTDEEITFEIYNYILQEDDVDNSYYFERANRNPPITPETLAELDMPRIINNPKLRHDVNFDRDLHFRQNMEGRDHQKTKAIEGYWHAMAGELFMYGYAGIRRRQTTEPGHEEYWSRVLKSSQRRLPRLFAVIRDILKSLVPDFEQRRITERLDVRLLMQEIMAGVCDLLDLSNWFSKVLKAHCAPMRDVEVDEMQVHIQRGAEKNDHYALRDGLRALLTILENMRLDVANHQIRHMRPLLIEDTINFQRRYNSHRISLGKIDVQRTRMWLKDEMEGLRYQGQEPTPVEAIASGMLREVLFNEAQLCPPTFYLDHDRLRSMRNELRRKACYQICSDVMTEFTQCKSQPDIQDAQRKLQLAVYSILRYSPKGSRFEDNIEHVATEVVRHALMAEGRYWPFDDTLVPLVESRLKTDLDPVSPALDKITRDACERLLPRVHARVKQCVKLSALKLQEVLMPSMPPPPPQASLVPFGMGAICTPVVTGVQYDPEEEFVKRMAHVVCLHWQVWGDLMYLTPAEEDAGSSSALPSSPASNGSPTIPVAQAVYAPGKQFLPVGVTVTEIPTGLPTPSASPEADAVTDPSSDITETATEPEQESLDAQQGSPA
jgi:hypothetical protein